MPVQYSNGGLTTGSEYQTKFSLVFKLCYLPQEVLTLKWRSNNRPFKDQTTFDHSNTKLVWYSDPHFNRETKNTKKIFFIVVQQLNIIKARVECPFF